VVELESLPSATQVGPLLLRYSETMLGSLQLLASSLQLVE